MCLFSNFNFWTAERHQKGPHRRCFKMSPFFRLAVRMTGAVRSRYRTGFSHHSRTGGHPQARATLGKDAYKRNRVPFQYFFSLFTQFYSSRCNIDHSVICNTKPAAVTKKTGLGKTELVFRRNRPLLKAKCFCY